MEHDEASDRRYTLPQDGCQVWRHGYADVVSLGVVQAASWQCRKCACNTFWRLVIEKVVSRLEHEEFNHRSDALDAVLRLGLQFSHCRADIVSAVSARLKHPNYNVRSVAAEAMGEIAQKGDPFATQVIIASADDRHDIVRCRALRAMGSLVFQGSSDALAVCNRLMNDPVSSVRGVAAEILLHLEDKPIKQTESSGECVPARRKKHTNKAIGDNEKQSTRHRARGHFASVGQSAGYARAQASEWWGSRTRLFGYYWCWCGHTWESGFSYTQSRQQCMKCHEWICAYSFKDLESGVCTSGGDREHVASKCSACRAGYCEYRRGKH